jgi:hypothetical protein
MWEQSSRNHTAQRITLPEGSPRDRMLPSSRFIFSWAIETFSIRDNKKTMIPFRVLAISGNRFLFKKYPTHAFVSPLLLN